MLQCSLRKFDLCLNAAQGILIFIYNIRSFLEEAEQMPEPMYEWLIARREVEWMNSKFCTRCSRSYNFPCKKAAATLLCGIPRWSRFLFAAFDDKKEKSKLSQKKTFHILEHRSHPRQQKWDKSD